MENIFALKQKVSRNFKHKYNSSVDRQIRTKPSQRLTHFTRRPTSMISENTPDLHIGSKSISMTPTQKSLNTHLAQHFLPSDNDNSDEFSPNLRLTPLKISPRPQFTNFSFDDKKRKVLSVTGTTLLLSTQKKLMRVRKKSEGISKIIISRRRNPLRLIGTKINMSIIY